MSEEKSWPSGWGPDAPENDDPWGDYAPDDKFDAALYLIDMVESVLVDEPDPKDLSGLQDALQFAKQMPMLCEFGQEMRGRAEGIWLNILNGVGPQTIVWDAAQLREEVCIAKVKAETAAPKDTPPPTVPAAEKALVVFNDGVAQVIRGNEQSEAITARSSVVYLSNIYNAKSEVGVTPKKLSMEWHHPQQLVWDKEEKAAHSDRIRQLKKALGPSFVDHIYFDGNFWHWREA